VAPTITISPRSGCDQRATSWPPGLARDHRTKLKRGCTETQMCNADMANVISLYPGEKSVFQIFLLFVWSMHMHTFFFARMHTHTLICLISTQLDFVYLFCLMTWHRSSSSRLYTVIISPEAAFYSTR